MKGFQGFPDGTNKGISLPALFFSELMPQIDHLVELQITLYCFWSLSVQEGTHRYIRWLEVQNDDILLKAISHFNGDPIILIRDGFERAVARGTLLYIQLKMPTHDEDIYFMNTEKGREAVNAIEQGNWLPGDKLRPIGLINVRPNIYVLYEQNIGALTPLIAQQLDDLATEFSQAWIQEAIKLAINQNIRNLNYIIGILKRWKRDGRSDSTQLPTNKESDRRTQMEEVQRKLGLPKEDEPKDE